MWRLASGQRLAPPPGRTSGHRHAGKPCDCSRERRHARPSSPRSPTSSTRPAKARRLLDEIGSAALKVVIDPANSVSRRRALPRMRRSSTRRSICSAPTSSLPTPRTEPRRRGRRLRPPARESSTTIAISRFCASTTTMARSILHGLAEAGVAESVAFCAAHGIARTRSRDGGRLMPPLHARRHRLPLPRRGRRACRSCSSTASGATSTSLRPLRSAAAGCPPDRLSTAGAMARPARWATRQIGIAVVRRRPAALLDHLGIERAVVGGISMGAAVALNSRSVTPTASARAGPVPARLARSSVPREHPRLSRPWPR